MSNAKIFTLTICFLLFLGGIACFLWFLKYMGFEEYAKTVLDFSGVFVSVAVVGFIIGSFAVDSK
jgi:hypothetical protein